MQVFQNRYLQPPLILGNKLGLKDMTITTMNSGLKIFAKKFFKIFLNVLKFDANF